MTSKIKVDNINKVSDDSNIINKCGTTITLGASGDTINLASGASQSGFGRTGTVDWQTGSIKTATFTAVNGEGYFCNTAGGTFEVDLPAGSAGAIVSVQDYNNTFDNNSLTVDPNGSEKINGGVAGGAVTLNVEGQGVTFVYIDATVGWRTVAGSDDPFAQAASNYVVATGGTILTCGDFKTHIFTAPGTFCVSNAGLPAGSNTVDYFVVAGGGGSSVYTGANQGMGGGGAGGFRLSNSYSLPAPTTSPLANPTGLAVPVQAYPITVGAGGAGGVDPGVPCQPSVEGVSGANSIFSSITSAGGGGSNVLSCGTNTSGGSGAGGGRGNSTSQSGGSGNTPPVSPSQGSNGGSGTPMPSQGPPAPAPSRNGGGGGGAATSGGNAAVPGSGAGGTGSYIAPGFVGPTAPSYGSPGPVSARYFAGGGGGAGGANAQAGGSGGGGAGARNANGGNGTDNTGGGGGGSNCSPVGGTGGTGGSGVVMIRYKFQNQVYDGSR